MFLVPYLRFRVEFVICMEGGILSIPRGWARVDLVWSFFKFPKSGVFEFICFWYHIWGI